MTTWQSHTNKSISFDGTIRLGSKRYCLSSMMCHTLSRIISDIKYTNLTIAIYHHIYMRQEVSLAPSFLFFSLLFPHLTPPSSQFDIIPVPFNPEAIPPHPTPPHRIQPHPIPSNTTPPYPCSKQWKALHRHTTMQCSSVRSFLAVAILLMSCPSPTPLDKSRRRDSPPHW